MSVLVDKNTPGRAGDHRQRRRISCAAMHGVRDECRCRRYAGKRRPNVRRQSAGLRHGLGSATENELQRLHDFRARRGRGGWNSRSGRCGRGARHLHHGRNPGDGYDAGESANGWEKIVVDRTELSGDYHSRPVQNWDYAGLHSQAGKRRRDFALGDADLRSSLAIDHARLRTKHCIGIGGDPINGMSHLDAVKLFNDDPETNAMIVIRGNWWLRRRRGGGMDQSELQETGGRIYRRDDRAAGTSHGSRRCDRFRRKRNSRRKNRSA